MITLVSRFLRTMAVVFALHFSLWAFSQVPFGRSNNTTLFNEFTAATVQMNTGKVLRVPKANIFMKNSSLLYKDMKGDDMEANMQAVKTVVFGERTFINNGGKLAEVIDTINGNKLLRTVLIDQEAMKSEYLNESNITSISGLSSSSDVLSFSRIDMDDSEEKYPLYATYHYVIGDKTILCHDRDVPNKISKAMRKIYNIVVHRDIFNWSDESDLKTLLHELSK